MVFYSNSADGKLRLVGEKVLKFKDNKNEGLKNIFHKKLYDEIKSNKINKFMDTPKEEACYLVSVQEGAKLEKEKHFLVLEQYGFEKTTESNDLINKLGNSREKYFPIGGIAFNIENLKVSLSIISNILFYFVI